MQGNKFFISVLAIVIIMFSGCSKSNIVIKDAKEEEPSKANVLYVSPQEIINLFRKQGGRELIYKKLGVQPNDELFKYTTGDIHINKKEIDISDGAKRDVILQIYDEGKSSWGNFIFFNSGDKWVFAGYTDYMFQNSSPKFRVVKSDNMKWLIIKYLDLYRIDKQNGYYETWYRIDKLNLVEEKSILVQRIK